MDKKVVKRSLVSYIGLFIVILGVFYFMNVLNTKVNDDSCFNIISCIKTVAAKMELKIQFKLIENKTHSGIGGWYKGLVLSCL